jgi:hypothetical protein
LTKRKADKGLKAVMVEIAWLNLEFRPRKGIDHQGQFGDRVANIVEQITELLEMPKVISDGKITLEQAMEIL